MIPSADIAQLLAPGDRMQQPAQAEKTLWQWRNR